MWRGREHRLCPIPSPVPQKQSQSGCLCLVSCCVPGATLDMGMGTGRGMRKALSNCPGTCPKVLPPPGLLRVPAHRQLQGLRLWSPRAPLPRRPPLTGLSSGYAAPPHSCGVTCLCKAQAHPCLGKIWKAASPGLGTGLRSLGVQAEPPPAQRLWERLHGGRKGELCGVTLALRLGPAAS